MSETLNKIEAKFADRSVATIETKEHREWLLGLPLAAKTRNKHLGCAREIFGLTVDLGYLPTNPLLGIKKFLLLSCAFRRLNRGPWRSAPQATVEPPMTLAGSGVGWTA
jgi:hypothetical protein